MIEFAATRGADRESLLSLTGLPQSVMNREDVRLPCSTMARMWSVAIEQTGDERLAMQMGVSRMFGANRTTSLIMEASATVMESFQLAARYSVLIADVMRVSVGEVDDAVYIDFEPRPVWRDQPEPVQLDCLAITYVAAVSSLSQLLGTRQPPSLLSLAFRSPPDVPTWVEVFGRRPEFGAERNRIGFPAALTTRPVATSDPGLQAAIRRYADELTRSFDSSPPTARRVKRVVVDALTPRPPSIDQVARSIGMSRRSLQRALAAEGQSYRRLVEEVRMDLSERYLVDGGYSVDQVARLVGYADTSSFVRAFKRCKGQPPRRYSSSRT